MSVAVKDETETTNEVAVEGITKAVTVGEVRSGKVITTLSFNEDETFPAASLAQAYNVFEPAVANVYVVGAEPVQVPSPADGVDDVSVRRYPVTAWLSVAVKDETETVRDVEVEGITKAVTFGFVVSEAEYKNVPYIPDP